MERFHVSTRRPRRSPSSQMFSLYVGLSYAALLESDGKTLRDPSVSYATLVMVQAPNCEPCKKLLPHLEALQGKMNEDGAAVMVATLNAVTHSGIADDLGVRGAQIMHRNFFSRAFAH